MLIYFKEVSLDEGFAAIAKPKEERLIAGRKISRPSGYILFEAMRAAGESMKCWNCGITANCFVLNKGQNDTLGPPVLDLFCDTGTDFVLMTRDHIIPKSYGGSNVNANLRVGCGPCNHGRGNAMDAEDIEFMKAHPELIVNRDRLLVPEGANSIEKMDGSKSPPKGARTEEQKAAARRAKNKRNRQRQKIRKAEAKAARTASSLPHLTTMLALALA